MVVESCDQFLLEKGKQNIMLERATTMITESI